MPISDAERAEIAAANRTGRTPVLLVHGLWLLAGCWTRWRWLFESEGFAAIAPGWPGEPATVAEARAGVVRPDLGVADITDHVAELAGRLDRRPVVIGHGFGGLVAQQLAGRGLVGAAVAVAPAPHRGIRRLPASAIRAARPVLCDPRNRGRAVMPTAAQFRYAFTNALRPDEAEELYATHAVPAPGRPLFQTTFAHLSPAAVTGVDARTARRGPLLVLAGERDHTVPRSLAYATYRRQRRNAGVTEFAEVPGRGHSLVLDAGWEQVGQLALEFVAKHARG